MDQYGIEKTTKRIRELCNAYDVKCYKHMPKGFKVLKNTNTQPNGTIWAYNGETVSSGKRKRCFVLEPWFLKLVEENKNKGDIK